MTVSPNKIKGSVRKAIRSQILKTLLGKTDARDNVTVNRSETNWQENLPAINIYIRGEEVLAEDSQVPRLLRRNVNLEIEAITDGRDGTELSNKLDDLGEQIEVALSADDRLDCTVDDIVLDSIEIETQSEGSKPVGSIRLTYKVRYHEFSPRDIRDQGVFPDFKGIDSTWDVTPEQADKPKDTIDYP